MSGKLQFREKLNGILELGNERQKVLSMEEVEKYFEEDQLSKEQMELVYDYLLSQKIAVTGYVKHGGTVREAEDEDVVEPELSEDEKMYLEEYMEELSMLRPTNEKEEKLQLYFPKVVEIAKELHTPEFFLGDLIQEGNVGLFMALEMPEHTEEMILEQIRQMMQMLVEEQNELKRQDAKMVEKVAFLDESVKNLTEELSRKPTLEELAIFMDMSEDEVNDILRLTGEDDDDDEDDDEDEE